MNNKILAILNQDDIFKIYDDLKKFSETHKVNEYVSSFIELINNESALIREAVFYGLLNQARTDNSKGLCCRFCY